MKGLQIVLAVAVLLASAGAPAVAQDPDSTQTVEIRLNNGNRLVGNFIRVVDGQVTFRLAAGPEITIARSAIVEITLMEGRVVNGEVWFEDPNYSRLIFAPTGRPLKEGDAYFSDFHVFLPGFAIGVTDNFTLLGGMSFIPGLGFQDQLYYVAPKIGGEVAEDVAVSAGALYTTLLSEDFAAGIGFASATFGPVDKSFTAGLGLGFTDIDNSGFEFADKPIIMLGGNVRLSRGIAFITENWLILGNELDQQPFTAGLRFLGERIAFDLGFLLVGELLAEGFPAPIVSFVYNFRD